MKLNNKGTFTDIRYNFVIASICVGVSVGMIDYLAPNHRQNLLAEAASMPDITWLDKLSKGVTIAFAKTPSWLSAFVIATLALAILLAIWWILVALITKLKRNQMS